MQKRTFFFSLLLLAPATLMAQVLIDGPEVDLTDEEVRMVLSTIPDQYKAAMLKDKNKLRQVMDTTYMTKVAASRAEKKGLQERPEVKAILWNRRQNLLAIAEIDDVLRQSGGDQGLESAAKETYLASKEDYKAPDSVTASHILIKAQDYASADAAMAELKKIRASILAKEITFADAAKKYSKDPGSATKGGELGQFPRGAMVKAFEDVAFALQNVGDISEPFESKFGLHIIQLDGKHPGGIRPFEDVKGQIMADLAKKRRKAIKEDYLITKRDDPAIKLNEAAIESFVSDPVGNQKQ